MCLKFIKGASLLPGRSDRNSEKKLKKRHSWRHSSASPRLVFGTPVPWDGTFQFRETQNPLFSSGTYQHPAETLYLGNTLGSACPLHADLLFETPTPQGKNSMLGNSLERVPRWSCQPPTASPGNALVFPGSDRSLRNVRKGKAFITRELAPVSAGVSTLSGRQVGAPRVQGRAWNAHRASRKEGRKEGMSYLRQHSRASTCQAACGMRVYVCSQFLWHNLSGLRTAV